MTDVAFVAGATGFVGKQLVAQLVAAGVKTIAHVRPDSRDLARWQTEFAAMGASVDITPWDTAAMTASLRKIAPTHVYCVIGTTRARAKKDAVAGNPYEAIDFGLTKILVDASVAIAPQPRFVYLSSIGANVQSSTAYLRARGRAEAAVMASGLAYRIARPSLITGPGREDPRPMERVSAIVLDGVLATIGAFGAHKTRDRYRAITSDALAAALIRFGTDDGGDRSVATEELR